jgi:hypothetical protein
MVDAEHLLYDAFLADAAHRYVHAVSRAEALAVSGLS